MKGMIVGVLVFFMLALAVGVAAAGAVSQAYNGVESTSVTAIAVSEINDFPQPTKPKNESGVYQAFTQVCPFH